MAPSRRRGPTARLALTAAGAIAGIWLLASPALGYLTAGGYGEGTGRTGSLQPLEMLPAVVGTTDVALLPGARADLVLRVVNPNDRPVTITGVSQAGGVTVTGGSGCTGDPAWPGALGTSGVGVPTRTGLDLTVPGGATLAVRIPDGAAMGVGAAAGCQGATFRVPVAVAVTQ
ncbi:hypothetical protein E8D34_04785 [Nocardioides sp. GY 10113]|uniref:hypothetical protein n=1 Tax=Nocardioides sp. GY 10113 TaxID=2569761 RepID=UPI0010A8B811|nr:hypothetical protein [Nocardioides sp. GY 10113]TIC88259.1 hypothetical protein E8D34_04785 [Nocardioides sp. GY 10113]